MVTVCSTAIKSPDWRNVCGSGIIKIKSKQVELACSNTV